MEILYLTSDFVQMSDTDLARNHASVNVERPISEWFDTHASLREPSDAWLKVRYRDSWFQAANDDLRSRSSFTLLNSIFH